MYRPSLPEFRDLARHYNLIPIYREILADSDTPVLALEKLGPGPQRFLFESVEGGERLGRYSFLGNSARTVIEARGHRVRLRGPQGEEEQVSANPLQLVKDVLSRYRPAPVPGLPRFYGGAVGYLGYDAVRYFEAVPDKNPDLLGLPDLYFLITDLVLVFDHVRRKIQVVASAVVEEGADVDAVYREAAARIDEAIEKLQRGPASLELLELPEGAALSLEGEVQSNVTREAFEESVRKAKAYIAAGDIFQVVLSQRLSVPWSQPPFAVYRVLRSLNPSPYMFYLDLGSFQLVGSSPEVMVRSEAGKAALRPIAGTRPRGATEEEDQRLARELLADAKERAEHVMLVDLGRNDLGRVCRPGSVQVDQLMTIERYSHVMHIVSNVVGELAPGHDAFDLLQACFPAGTVSGAPKIRAMEIIDELENTRRGPYAGAVGYFAYSGNMDSCITIRTIVIQDGRAHIQTGAGIVADSDPAAEYHETLAKAQAMLRALALTKEATAVRVSHHR